jgi:hypothetical protein
LLRADGRIFLEVPDASRCIPRRDTPFDEFSTESINFFSIFSLTNLLQQRGFRAVAGGYALRLRNETTFPTTFVVFEKSSRNGRLAPPLPLERDIETETGLRRYIQGCQAEEVRSAV